ncbi:hypothetical protein [Litoribacillus peritrichatus]|uniref:Uncharacterized protein n=1 Tax=Litoribacillus peritrichatus TaxID=718191 RepID=A0ABP7MJA4_9GAMM
MINSEKVSEVKTELLNACINLDNDDKRAREQEKNKKMRATRLSIELYREQQELLHQTEEFLFREELEE